MYICIAYFHVERSNIEASACETGQDGLVIPDDRVCKTTAHIKSSPKVNGFVFCMSKQNALETQKFFKHVLLRKLQTRTLLHA